MQVEAQKSAGASTAERSPRSSSGVRLVGLVTGPVMPHARGVESIALPPLRVAVRSSLSSSHPLRSLHPSAAARPTSADARIV